MTTSNTHMLTEYLQKLDLPKNSSIVFQFLLHNGEQKAIPITHATGLYKQSVYSALEDLEHRGMIKKILKNNVSQYRVLSVEPLLKEAEERYQAACTLGKIVKNTQKRPDSSVAFYEGIEGVHSFTQFVLEYGKPLDILGANIRFRQYYPEIFDTWLTQWNRKKIRLRLLVPQNIPQELTERLPGVQMRFFDAAIYPGATWIFGDYLVHIVWTTKELTEVTCIYNPILAEQQRDFFQYIWKTNKI